MRVRSVLAPLITLAITLLTIVYASESQSSIEDLNRPLTDVVISAFEKFKLKYKKNYSTTEEERYRLQVFNDFFHRMMRITNQGNKDFTVGITKFADLTRDEFKTMYTNSENSFRTAGVSRVLDTSNLRPVVDWVAAGAVTPIKDQGQCGSSPYFSAVVSMEGGNWIKTGQLISLSEQQIIDCSTSYGNQGCNGGWMNQSIQYAIDNGMESEADYPYVAAEQNCAFNKSKAKVFPKAEVDVMTSDQDQLAAALVLGPVAGAIDASSEIFQGYTGGVITSTDCGQQVDHGIGLVGYDTTQSPPFFRLKNTWGTDFGEKGYVRVMYQQGDKTTGICGVATFNSYATF